MTVYSKVTVNGFKITEREYQIWEMMANGKSAKEIATVCDVGTKTIETQRGHLYKKINAKCLADAVRLAVRYGVITVEVIKPTAVLKAEFTITP
jgi:DNA-binding CsgD family transcriptional regulator